MNKIPFAVALAMLVFAPMCMGQEPLSERPPSRDELLSQLKDKDAQRRQSAAAALAAKGVANQIVLDELVRAMGEVPLSYPPPPPEGPHGAMFSLASLKGAAVPTLTKAFQDRAYRGRYFAVQALGMIGPDAKEALPAITRAVEEGRDPLRPQLLAAKWRIDGDAEFAVSRLTPLLKEKDQRQCGGAITVLSNMGPSAKDAVPAIVAAMNEHHEGELAYALGEIGTLETVSAALYAALDDPALVHQASEALSKLGAPSERIIPRLIKTLEKNQEHIHAPGTIALALRPFGADAKPAVPLLIKGLTHPNVMVRVQTVETLGAIGPGASAAIPALTEALDDIYIQDKAPQALKAIRSEEK